jgi:8-oxo-dGTP pyrophosphatase MutT (NUDIX family)
MIERRGPWSIASKREVYDNRWIKVTHHEVVTPSGTPGIYGTVHYKNLALGVLPIDREGNTYLVGQYRFALKEYSWEIPEGGGAPDDDPLQSIARELREETGLRAGRWHKLLECDLSNSVSDERAMAFLAWDLTQGEASPEPSEELVVRKMPLKQVFQMADAGEIRDAISMLSLQAVERLLLKGKLQEILGPEASDWI